MENLYGQLGSVITLVISVAGLGAGLWLVVELLKIAINTIGGVLPADIKLGGQKTWFIAAFVAAGYVLGLDVNVLGDFSAFDGFDPDILASINTVLLTFGANTWHDKVFGVKS